MEQRECSRILQSHAKALWGGNPQPWQEEATWAERWGIKCPCIRDSQVTVPCLPSSPTPLLALSHLVPSSPHV